MVGQERYWGVGRGIIMWKKKPTTVVDMPLGIICQEEGAASAVADSITTYRL